MRAMTDGAHLYIVRCADGSFYTGTARNGLERRIDEHNNGMFHGFTATRRPVMLVYSQWFARITDAIAAERQVKGWSRAKKEALIQGNFDKLSDLARRGRPHPSRRPPAAGSSEPGRKILLSDFSPL
jgi:putative endonuclease